MMIFIRHAEKAYLNGGSSSPNDKKHDPPLTESGKKSCSEKAKELIKLYGKPTSIISSPFRRCRETAIELSKELDYTLEIKVECMISEYLGNHRNVNLDITPETASYGIKHPESWKHFMYRTRCYAEKIRRFEKSKKEEIIWIVTHGVVMQNLCKFLKLHENRENIGTRGNIGNQENIEENHEEGEKEEISEFQKKKTYAFLETEIYIPKVEKLKVEKPKIESRRNLINSRDLELKRENRRQSNEDRLRKSSELPRSS